MGLREFQINLLITYWIENISEQSFFGWLYGDVFVCNVGNLGLVQLSGVSTKKSPAIITKQKIIRGKFGSALLALILPTKIRKVLSAGLNYAC